MTRSARSNSALQLRGVEVGRRPAADGEPGEPRVRPSASRTGLGLPSQRVQVGGDQSAFGLRRGEEVAEPASHLAERDVRRRGTGPIAAPPAQTPRSGAAGRSGRYAVLCG